MAVRILSTSLFVLYINAETNKSGVCNVTWTNHQFQMKCCVDFLLVNNICKPCIGRHGINCTEPCKFGYYGFGCRHHCNCSDRQGCDRQTGCFNIDSNEDKAHYAAVAFCSVLITSAVFVVAILIYKKYGETLRALITATSGRQDRNSRNYGKEQYDDIRESRMVLDNNGGHEFNSRIKSMTSGCPRRSDNYHHLTSTRGIPLSVKLNILNDEVQHPKDQSCNQ